MLALGAGLLAMSMAVDSTAMLVLGAIASGLGQGGIFAASIVAVTAASPDDQKAEVSSLLFVVVYLAVSIPVLGLGFAIDAMGLRDAGITFALLVLLLSVTTLGLLWRRRTHAVVVAG
jgi:F0F1-type ATP synthase membrane subunit c/vacuolar-type H+-ATPase subunit K